MEDFKFTSLEDLYKRLTPALSTKVADLKRNNIKYIKEEDVWNYLKENYWRKTPRLTLGEMVNDILSTPNDELEKYACKNLEKKPKKINKEELL